MNFINEHMPELEKGKLNFPVFTHNDGSKPTLWKWTIDRGNKAFLVLVNTKGGAYEGTPLTSRYVLSWHGNVVTMSARCSDPARESIGIVMAWEIFDIKVPESLRSKNEEVLKLIDGAFSVLGRSYNGDQYALVDVKII